MSDLRISVTPTVIFACVIIISSCNGLKLDSQWRRHDIVIDGSHSEWEGSLLYSEEKRVTVGFINDDEYLYLCLLASDQHILMQSLAVGFTVWFDGMGNNRRKFGIKFPIGGRMPIKETPGNEGHRGLQEMTRRMLVDQTELELLQSDEKERINFSELDDYGIDLRIGQYLDRFIYELRIPIQNSVENVYAVYPKKDGTIKVKFELGKLERRREGRRPPGDGEGFPGGMRPPGGGPGGMRGSRPEGPRSSSEELKLRIKVRLAEPPKNEI